MRRQGGHTIPLFGQVGPWEAALIDLVAFVLAAGIARFLLRRVAARLARRSKSDVDDQLIRRVVGPVSALVVLAGLHLVVARLRPLYPADGAAMHYANEAIELLSVLVVTACADSVLGVLSTWYLRSIATRTDTSADDQFLPLIRTFGRVVIWFLGATFALSAVGQNINGLIATAGVASLALAFAAQETLSNLFSGLMIMTDRPFRVGDRIEVGSDIYGTVTDIGLRSTRVLTFDNTLMTVPNRDIANSRIVNHVLPEVKVSLQINLQVAHGTDVERVKEILVEIAKAHPHVLDDPTPGVYFTSIDDRAFNLLVWLYVDDYRNRFGASDELNMEIARRFAEAGITFPHPQRDVYIREAPESR